MLLCKQFTIGRKGYVILMVLEVSQSDIDYYGDSSGKVCNSLSEFQDGEK